MAVPPGARGSCCSLGFYFQKGPFLRIDREQRLVVGYSQFTKQHK
jgi:hypothetical protein